MSDSKIDNRLGLLLKRLINERSLSMRKLSALTEIDTATISRIISGKRKAKLEHLQKFANCLEIPIADLFAASGYSMEQKQQTDDTDYRMSFESIQTELKLANLHEDSYKLESIEQQLVHYEQYVQTDEGKENIHQSFSEKLKKIGSIGPFISQIKEMYEKFRHNMGTPRELAMFGSALIYFIVSVDVIPDYIFPVGFIDDAMAIQIVRKSLAKKVNELEA